MNPIVRLTVIGVLFASFTLGSVGAQPSDAVIRNVSLAGASDVVYDPARELLYASVNFGPGVGVYPIDPVAGTVGTRMISGATYQLAIADDNSYLYADQQSTVVRIDLTSQLADLTFAVPLTIEDMQVRPGYADTVALSLKVPGSPRSRGVWLYRNGTKVAQYWDGESTNALAFDGPGTLYAFDQEISSHALSEFTVHSSGISLVSRTQALLRGGPGIKIAGGLLYASSGRVVDPVALQLVGTNVFSIGNAVEVDSAANRVFILGSDYYGQQISVYEADSHSLQAQIPVPSNRGTALVRWGLHGLVYVGVDRIVLVESTEILDPTISPVPTVVMDGPGVRHFDMRVVDLSYHQPSGRLVATTYGDVEDFGNSALVIEPQLGSIERAVYVGSSPTRMSQSRDGHAFYVALAGQSSVSRLRLPDSTLSQFSIGRNDFTGPLFAEDLAAVPGSTDSVAVSLRNFTQSPRHEGVALYDAGVRRPATVFHHGGNNLIEAASATTLYGSDAEISPSALHVMSIAPDGLHETAAYTGLAGEYEYSEGLLYSITGRVVDPAIPMEVANLNVWPPTAVEPDPATDRLFIAASDGIRVYSLSTFAYQATIPAPFSGSAETLVRWGANGLAYSTRYRLYLVDSSPEVVVSGGACLSDTQGKGVVNLTLSDPDTAVGNLTLSTTSSNQTLLPSTNVVTGGGGAARTLTLTTVARQTGTATVMVSVGDGTNTTNLNITVKVGSAKNEMLIGASGPDVLFGLNGQNAVSGLGGNDLLCGGNGVDTLIGGAGNDAIDGGRGSDTLTGGLGADSFDGGPGTDAATDFDAGQGDTMSGIP